MREVGYVFGRSRATGGFSQKAISEKSPKGISGLFRCCEVTSALDTLQDRDSIPWLGVQTKSVCTGRLSWGITSGPYMQGLGRNTARSCLYQGSSLARYYL